MIKKQLNSITDVLDKATVSSIAMISILVSFLTLSIPLAAQTLINLIAFGKLFQPVVTLSMMVLVLMLATGGLNIWQSIIIELIQQKLMVKISLNLTRQFTKLSLDNFSLHHGPELVNRFFEVVTVNKALASLLLYGVNLSLQLFFGLLLLLIYHPLFLLFDAFIVISILITVFLPYRKGLASAKEECSQKHKIGAWLEELLTNRYLFRFNHYDQFAIHQSDKLLVSFLKARNTHFKQLIKHQIGFYLLSAFASSLLLGLGGYLVINNQLSLGQLVAAELVLGALLYGLKRFGVLLENYYDLVASEDKIDTVLNLPCETINSGFSELIIPIQSITFETPNTPTTSATPENPILIDVTSYQHESYITELILGFRENADINILINKTLCTEEQRRILRQYTLLIRKNEWFAGSIYDNLRLSQSPFSIDALKELLVKFGLMNKILHLKEGLKSIIYDWERVFTELELVQLMVIRALLVKPQLIVVDHAFDNLQKQDIDRLVAELLTLQQNILIIVSLHPDRIPISNLLVLS